jgi:hypothetical protein
MIFGRQYEPFVIPCKPTAPNIKVELVNQDGEVTFIRNMYDQEKGFEVNFTEITYGFFDCRVSNDKTNFLQIDYQIYPRTSKSFLFSNFDVQKIFNQKNIYSRKRIYSSIVYLSIYQNPQQQNPV